MRKYRSFVGRIRSLPYSSPLRESRVQEGTTGEQRRVGEGNKLGI